MSRFSAPVIMVTAILIAGCNGLGSAASSAPSTSASNQAGPVQAAAKRPTLDLTITGGQGAGSYVSDPSSSLNVCSRATDGSWRVMYAGGEPWLSVDLLVGSHAAEAGRASDLALEISVGPAYLWIDQPKFRGGDAPGRSRATVTIQADGDGTTFDVVATTPNRTPAGDGEPSDVALTVVCPG
jgi:hypothetical protein